MHKLSFYSRLAAGNLWRNRKTYLPYLLACVVSIFTFYTMLAINMNGALNGMRNESVVKSFTAIGAVILAIFCSVLIFYTNSFLIKRRKKELGLYSILGMEKRNIAILMLFETLFVAALALVLGLGLGLLLSRLLFWVLLRMVRFEVMLAMPASPAAIGITMAFFALVFLLALLFNLRQVRLANPVDLMAGAKHGEKEPKASWLLTAVGILALGAGYFVALYFSKPVEVLFSFLAAVALVILGTYCLFTSGSIALLKLLRKNKTYYYQPNHFISVSGMIYRMKQNATGLATICILSCMVLVTVSGTVSLNVGLEDALQTQYPYEYSLRFDEPQDADILLAAAQTAAQESGAAPAALQDYRVAEISAVGQNGVFTASDDYSALAHMLYINMLPLEDYNRNEGKNVVLAADEALFLMEGGRYEGDTLTLNGHTFRMHPLETLGKTHMGRDNIARVLTLVLPDMAAINAVLQAGQTESPIVRRVAFDLNGSAQENQLFAERFSAIIGGLHTQQHFRLSVREEGRQDWYASDGGFLFIGIYFSILFMLAAALIIYYKQMSEGYDDAARFDILQKVGMSEDEVKKTINSQILTVFFLPLAVAVVHMVVAFFPISRAMVIFGILNKPLLAVTSLATLLAYALIYLLVYRQTAKTYFRVVRRQAASA